MKNVAKRIFEILNKNSYLFLIFVFSSGILFRTIYPGNVELGFDQVQILVNAHQIIVGDKPLVGPATGPVVGMYTGPLIYYLAVPFIKTLGDFHSIVVIPLFLSVITGLSLFFLSQRYLGKKASYLLTTIWSFSPFLVSLNRIFWNPDLILLSTFLIFIPLLSILKKTNDRFTYLFLFLGSFLSYQAHFSGLLVVALFVLSILYLKESFKFIISVLTGLILSLLPTILFDLKNNFTNFKGLLSLITDKSDFGLLPFLSNILYNTYEMIQTLGKMFFFWNITETTFSFGLLVIVIPLVYFWDKKDFKLVFLWIIGIIVSYSFYDGANPHYYFLIAVPPLLYIIFGLLTKVKTKFLNFLIAFFILNSTLINLNYYKNNTGVTNGNIARIYNFLKKRSVKDLKYHLDQELKIGFQYTFSKLNLETDGDIYHISYPDELSSDGLEKVSNLGIWVEKKPSL